MGDISLAPWREIIGWITANHYKVILMNHLYPIIKHFHPDGSGLFRDDSAHGVTEEWFDEDEKDAQPLRQPDFNPTEHLWRVLDSTLHYFHQNIK